MVVLPSEKGRSSAIFEHFLEKCGDHVNNGPNQLPKKGPTTKVKAKAVKQLKALKDNAFIDNRLYQYFKPSISPEPRFYDHSKMHKQGDPISPFVLYPASPLYILNKYIVNILKAYVKDKNNKAKILSLLWRKKAMKNEHFVTLY